jgi:hypothetical protein
MLSTRSCDSDALSMFAGSLESVWTITRREHSPVAWYEFACRTQALPSQGWKIHVSLSTREAHTFCENVLPWLHSEKVTFKIAANLETIISINSGQAGESQVGKILTIYPEDDQQAATIALQIDQLWPATEGPAVPSDLELRPGGAVFLRYGSFGGHLVVDRFGKTFPTIRAPDGVIVEDFRNLNGEQPSWAVPPLPGLRSAASGSNEAAVHLGDDCYLPLILIHHSPLGRVFLGLSLVDASQVIIKKRVNGLGFGPDAVGERLRCEFEILQRLCAFDCVAPKPLGHSLDQNSPTLVMEHIAGRSFMDLDRQQQVLSLGGLALAVQRLHDLGFAHRDLKLANAICTDHGVRLVDFELAAPLGTEGLLAAGTQGHFPPELNDHADVAVDMFALGVCVAHVFLGIDPANLPSGAGRLVGFLNLSRYRRAAEVVRQLTAFRPEKRPSARVAVKLISHLASDDAVETGHAGRPRRVSRAWCLRVARECGQASRKFDVTIPGETGWQSAIAEGEPAEAINMGAAGVLLGLISIDHACRSAEFCGDIRKRAEWLAGRPAQPNAHGFFTGNSGVALALGIAAARYGRPDWREACRSRLVAAMQVNGDCDLFSGVAGVLWAASSLYEIQHDSELYQMASGCADYLMQHAQIVDGFLVWPAASDGDSPLTGAAHGSAGIAMVLGIWGQLVKRCEIVALALETFERLFRNGRTNNGQILRRAVNEPSSSAPVMTWCHGIAGYLWCMMLAFGDHTRLTRAIDWSLEQCAHSLHLGSPVIWHGVAGELELWRLISAYPRLASGAKSRANRAASILRLQLRRERGLTLWGSENPQLTRPDLWVGFLGPAVEIALYARQATAPILSAAWLQSCASQFP